MILADDIFSENPSDTASFKVRSRLASKLGSPASVEVPTGIVLGWKVATTLAKRPLPK